MMARIISSYGPALQRRTTTGPVLQTLILPRVTAEYQPGKLATTETRQPCTRGSLRVTLAVGASGPERAPPTRPATAVAGTARPFTMVSVAAERRSLGRAAEAVLGAAAVGAGKATDGTEGELGS